jgi:hypothetical protein
VREHDRAEISRSCARSVRYLRTSLRTDERHHARYLMRSLVARCSLPGARSDGCPPPDQRRCRARTGPRARACARRRRPVCRCLREPPWGRTGAASAARGSLAVARGPGLHNAALCKGRSPKARGPRASAHNAGIMRTRGLHQIARSAFRNSPARSMRQHAELARSRRSRAAHATPPGPRACGATDLTALAAGGRGDHTQARSAHRISRVRPECVTRAAAALRFFFSYLSLLFSS